MLLAIHETPVRFCVWLKVRILVCIIPKIRYLINKQWMAGFIIPGSPLIWILGDNDRDVPKIGPLVSAVVHDCTGVWTRAPTLTFSLLPPAQSQLLLFLRTFIL